MKLTQRNRNGYLESKKYRQCTNCLKIFKKNNKNTSRICKICNTKRVKSNSAEYKMLARAKMRAKDKKLKFNLTIKDIIIPKVCPVLKIPLVVHSGRSGSYKDSPSLDRIVPNKGYVKGNIMVMSSLANAMKQNATKEELLLFSKWILKNYK